MVGGWPVPNLYARRAGAVNTLKLEPNGVILGDNTDGAGLVRDMIVNLQWSIAGRRVLVLGAGVVHPSGEGSSNMLCFDDPQRWIEGDDPLRDDKFACAAQLGLAEGEPKFDVLEKRLAEFPVITVPTITLEGDANGWAYRKDWFAKPELQAEFKQKHGRALEAPKTWPRLIPPPAALMLKTRGQ